MDTLKKVYDNFSRQAVYYRFWYLVLKHVVRDRLYQLQARKNVLHGFVYIIQNELSVHFFYYVCLFKKL